MNWIDVAILVVWAVAAFWGFRTGLLQMVVLLVMVGVGLALSSRLAGPVANLLSPFIADQDLRTIAAFGVVFVVLLVIAAVASHILGAITRPLTFLGPVNRLGGMAMGVLVGFVVLSGVLTGLQKFPIGGVTESIDSSALGTFLADHFDVVIRGLKLVPTDWELQVSGPK
jgi:membrane protein required for colicin V production